MIPTELRGETSKQNEPPEGGSDLAQAALSTEATEC